MRAHTKDGYPARTLDIFFIVVFSRFNLPTFTSSRFSALVLSFPVSCFLVAFHLFRTGLFLLDMFSLSFDVLVF